MQNYLNEVELLSSYIQTRFPDPDNDWSDEKRKARSCEQVVSEFVILDCYDNLTCDPKDILWSKILYYDYLLGTLNEDEMSMKETYECSIRTCYILLSYLNSI